MEQRNVCKLFDLRYDWFDAANSTNQQASSTPIPLFLCPSAPKANRMVLTKDASNNQCAAGATDYCGVPAAYLYNNQATSLFAGAMNYRYGSYITRISDVRDGTSNTLIVVEMADKPSVWRAGRLVTDNSGTVYNAAGNSIGSGQWAAPNWNHLRSYSFDGATQFGPCAVNCSNGASIYAFHPGGANVLFVDGSVHFLSQARTSQELMVALVTANGGEVLSSDDF
jgi:prepilin-type processing-associated H-X9-DG protein